MKKIFKGLSVLVATAALGAGMATATACNGGNGKFYGTYDYVNEYGAHYGVVVEVTVENNIITKVRDITNTESALSSYQDGETWTTVSPGWEDYFDVQINYGWLLWTTESKAKDDEGNEYKVLDNATLVDSEGVAQGDFEDGKQYYKYLDKDGKFNNAYVEWEKGVYPDPAATAIYSYSWYNSNAAVWTNYESLVLQKYEGLSVSDILDIQVFIKETGEVYDADDNPSYKESELLKSGASQSFGRLLLAVQNALGKTTEIGRIGEEK